MAPSLAEHCKDLDLIASGEEIAAVGGFSARDIGVSIENVCKNALDDEIAGAVSALFERNTGLPALLMRSLESSRRNEPPLRELRMEVLKLIEFLILDLGASSGVLPGHHARTIA